MWPVIALKVHTVMGDGVKTVLPLKGSRCGSLLYTTGMWPGAEMELVSRWSHGHSWTDLEIWRSLQQKIHPPAQWWMYLTVSNFGGGLRLHWSPWYWLSRICFDTKSEHLWRGSIYHWCPGLRRTTESSLPNVKVFTSCNLFTQRRLLPLYP